uniref:AlNc14C218G9050 protein n=1 Tax=Albugo laibachii Nc14 TaxID=890382 RepID=F0WRQ4_9STRA|nr:AlNc14C218G9050 [Albugo laibachii Nc14]|eukprot:CCA24019.1 AlNc14C218G9050 [Albugo laibachii Nc14]
MRNSYEKRMRLSFGLLEYRHPFSIKFSAVVCLRKLAKGRYFGVKSVSVYSVCALREIADYSDIPHMIHTGTREAKERR